ncbi:hypothetical protein V3Q90_14885 [Flavobacterium oreochromis]|uniref:hypothetical protein n=1 Tax=Flavobacterium oreochromis TaxID=2906078 RepID=UPI00385F780F
MRFNEFNKEKALDQLIEILNVGKKPKPSEVHKSIERATLFLKNIHQEGFAYGYIKGVEVTEKINNYASENPNL